MKVVYTAPNRAHHYKYAGALNAANCLHAFISGFPRINSRSTTAELKGKLHHSDILQTLYIASLKGKLPSAISLYLAYLSKVEQDIACRKFIDECNVFLFYNGSGLMSCRYAKKKGVITIVEAVNSHVEFQEDILETESKNLNLRWKPFPLKEKMRRVKEYEEADYILLPSEFVKRSFIAKGFPERKLLKVSYGFNKSSYHDDANIKNDQGQSSYTILYVGSICVRKGVRYLIEAFKKLSHPKKRLVLVGPNVNDGALNGLILTPDIVFTGVLKGKNLEQAYHAADVFCLPSIEEGLALVLGEALSFGLPIITTCNTGADDIITDGREGYILPIRDSISIWQKLQAFVDDPELFKKFQQNAFNRSKQLNGWEETGKNLVSTLSKVKL